MEVQTFTGGVVSAHTGELISDTILCACINRETVFDNERLGYLWIFAQVNFKSLHVFSRECDDNGTTVESQHSWGEY